MRAARQVNRMLPTPQEHLPRGYPLPTPEENKRYERIFARAFDIHARAHDFSAVNTWLDEHGITHHDGPRTGILSMDSDGPNYCDCYERAYREFDLVFVTKRTADPSPLLLNSRRSIRL